MRRFLTVRQALPTSKNALRREHSSNRLAIASADIVALVDHDPGRLLGRTRSRTLRLSEDNRGLQFEIDVADTSLGRDVLANDRARRHWRSMFSDSHCPKGGDRWEGRTRTLVNVELRDISIVSAWPAYSETTVSARSAAASKVIDCRWHSLIGYWGPSANALALATAFVENRTATQRDLSLVEWLGAGGA